MCNSKGVREIIQNGDLKKMIFSQEYNVSDKSRMYHMFFTGQQKLLPGRSICNI